MDGRFVPNIGFGPMVIEFIRKATCKPAMYTLMIEEPEKYAAFQKPVPIFNFLHYEVCTHLTLQYSTNQIAANERCSINPLHP